MANPILLVTNNGYGETPVPADAVVKIGDTLNIHDENDGSLRTAYVVAIVPVGTPREFAIADQNGEARPFAITEPRHTETLYILGLDGQQVAVGQSNMKRGLDKAEAAGLNKGETDR